jgi:hypothetical protein
MATQVVTSSGYVQVVSNTAAVSSVAASITAVTLQAANTDRIHLSVFNDSTSALYLKWGAAASTSSFSAKIPPAGYYELSREKYWAGIITAVWDTATGSARVTEAT